MKKKPTLFFKILILIFFCISIHLNSFAQRQTEKLDRGVVAVKNASANYFVSWRYLATDPEDIQFNLYAKKAGTAAFVQVNPSPLAVPNYQPTTAHVSTVT